MTTVGRSRYKATGLHSCKSVDCQNFSNKMSANAKAFLLQRFDQATCTIESLMFLKRSNNTGGLILFFRSWLIALVSHITVIGTTTHANNVAE